MKNLPPTFRRLTGRVVASLALLAAVQLRAAGSFTVNTPVDSHAVSPATSATNSSGNVSLRSAIEAANVQGGPITINLPANAYNLTLGELEVAPNGGVTNTILGAGAAATLVTQMDPTNRVFNVDSNSLGRTIVSLSGITIQGGHDGVDFLGGAGILAGSITNAAKDILSLTNCTIQNNHCTSSTSREPGGGIQMAGGDLDITSCIFSNNSSGQSFGGAIFVFAQSVISSLNVSNSVFINNSLTNSSFIGPDGGGAIMVETPTGSVHSVLACGFTNNRATGLSGLNYGGAIQLNGGALTIAGSTFVNNAATGSSSLGGAIYADSGTVTMSLSRLAGNTAVAGGGALYNHGSNLASTTATNDWWGCDDGPGVSGCNLATGDGATLTYSPWLFITNTASPGSILPNGTTTLTASVLTNSSGRALAPSQIGVLIGLPLSWAAGPNGVITTSQNTIQPGGTATATYTNVDSCNNGVPSVTLDNGTSVANVNVQCATAPDLVLSNTNNVTGVTAEGTPWVWTLHVTNTGAGSATFASGNAVLLDNLPNSGLTYTSVSVANAVGVSGTLIPAIDGSKNLTVTASGIVTVNPGGSFDVLVLTAASTIGTYTNPRTGGICMVDPNNVILEFSEANNNASNSVVVTCPVISATISGSTAICLGSTGVVEVTLSGGNPPYSVSLANGAGTQVGSSPLFFPVSPSVTTPFQIGSGSDSQGCPVTPSGSATITVNTATAPVITPAQSGVLANSGGNQATATAGFAAYAWTITNGIITGSTNQATVTYIAGTTNTFVGLGVTTYNACGMATAFATVPIITGFSVHTNVTFTDGLTATTMGMTFDGTNYWSCSGGSSSGVRLAEYGLNGAVVNTFSPGLDFRSLMTLASGQVLARAYNNNTIYQQTSPGVFASSGIALTGGTLNIQSSVVLNGAQTEFDAMSAGVVSRWSTNGTYLGAVNLNGFGNLANENLTPQNRGLAAYGNFWLTYDGAGNLSVWDTNGNRVAQISLPGAGTTTYSDYGFSFCNGKVFIVSTAGGTWYAYDLYTAARVAVLSAESTAAWNTDITNKIAALGSIPRVDLIPVITGTSVPTLAQLLSYQSVMLFSDFSFDDSTNLGNVLANYIDQGGGAVLQTFAFYNGSGLGLEGRITNSYLPFTTAAYGSPGGLTLVKDLPTHPLLDNVSSFNGGTASFQNSSISIAPGATLVGHWSNGQPLVGGKQDGVGWFAGLNFFPPSSDVRSDFWVSSTDGAKLMANALLWSGKIPPTILSAPADQIVPIGSTATFKVAAVGTSTLGYQWRLNGANIANATNATLSFTVTEGRSGAYSVVVSNLYGTTTSINASLNPPLRLLAPVLSGSNFSLYLMDVDGSAVAASRAARVSIYGTTNLALPISLWQLLTNPVVSSGSQLRSDGYSTGNSTIEFYRADETP